MERILPATVEAVLLYNQYNRYGPRELLSLLNQAGGESGLQFTWVPSDDTDVVVQFISDTIGVEIIHADHGLSQEGFQDALDSGYTRMVTPEARDAVEGHDRHVYITVGRLAENAASGPERAFNAEEFDTSVSLLKMLIMVYVSRSKPLVIHWMQSNKLLSVRQFAELALESDDISLLIHPSLYKSGEVGDNGRDYTGFYTYGATNLIGCEVHFEPAPIDPARLFERTLQLIMKTRETGLMIPDNDTFGIDDSEEIRIRYVEDEHYDNEIIKLTYERCEELGIKPLAETVEVQLEPGEGLLDDPVERALQEKISALKSEAEESVFSFSEDAETDVQDTVKEVEPWQGVTKRNDIAALRALTKTGQEQNEVERPSLESPVLAEQPVVTAPEPKEEALELADAAPEKSSGLMGKVSGIFSKRGN